MSESPSLSAVLARWQELREQGRDATAGELCRDCPGLLDEAERCLAVLRRVGGVGESQQTLPPDAALPPADLHQRACPAGYEILGELGRGGMGVVYKARQVGLNRVVALKMILAGGHAGQAERARFRFEAEAIARLRHPNILQVYETGECGGLPYFSLEFCAGGSLADRLAGKSLPPREAAGLVATLAGAVHAAHQNGILHRDLKPANVLLDEGDTPKVADFGLAKRLDEQGQTRTGAVLGTPNYMAPEQAAGRGADVSTLADVYALGAILYECLTGRPPFRAATALDTVLQVLEQPPTPPSAHHAGLDRGLELICLKCLEKDPARRYSSAAALADDLQRWLAGEPVSVRPPSLAALVRSWVRQNFGAAGWTVVVGGGTGALAGLAIWLAGIQPAIARVGGVYRHLPDVPRPWLALPWQVPGWLKVSVLLTAMVISAGLGLFTAWLVRPRHRAADVAAGLITGLVAAVAVYTLSFGWWVSLARMAPLQADVDRISQAAWGQDQAAARADLLRRYPDLERVRERQRGAVLSSKVLADLSSEIPVSIWLAMLVALVWWVGFGIGSTAVAGPLVRTGWPWWRVLLSYLEVALPAAAALPPTGQTVVAPFLPLVRTTAPGWHTAALAAVCLAAIVAALRRWPLPFRLILQAAWVAVAVWGELAIAR